MVRVVDDMFIVWERANNQFSDWKDFKLCVNQESHLKWFCEDLGEEVVFLELGIWIDRQNRKFVHKPHTKKESLLLHLPPHSVHSKEA